MRNKHQNIFSRIVVTLVIALAIIYIGFSIYFLSHFIPGTVINEENVSFKSVSAVEKRFTEEADNFSINISGRDDKTGVINASEISLKPIFNGEIDEALSGQNAFLWPVGLIKKTEHLTDSVAEFEEKALYSAFDKLGFYDGERAPVDAHLSDYTDDGYQVVAEDEGSTLDREKAYEALKVACGSLIENVDLDEAGCYIRPTVFSDNQELIETADNLNQYVSTKITYSFGSEKEYLDGNIIKDWLNVEGTSVSLDRAKVKEYVDGLARSHDTFGRSRSFKTSKGNTITVSGGDYGWWTDRVSTTDELTEAITNGKQGEMTPVYFGTAEAYGDNDIGDTYVEVDLDNQHVYCYVSGNLVTGADCVSGKVSTGNFTPDGTYAITYKERDATLVGENYSSPVKFWMPFNGNIGLHDASWRSNFGGSLYVTGGSHGCVNLPSSAAKTIFENVHKGEPVVVYGGKQSVPKAEPTVETPSETTDEELQQQLLQQLLDQVNAANAANAANAEGAAENSESAENTGESQTE